MNSFLPALTNEQYQICKEAYESIIEEQTIISYSIKGISYQDTDSISRYDRKLILKSLEKIRKIEKEAQEKALAESQSKNFKYS